MALVTMIGSFPHLPTSFRIGIAFASQEVEEIPPDATNASMDIIVTDTSIIRCGSR